MTAEQRRKNKVNSKYYTDGQRDGITFILTALAWVMLEVKGEPPEAVQSTLDALEDFCTDFERGNIRFTDIVQVLKDEYNTEINFGKRERERNT